MYLLSVGVLMPLSSVLGIDLCGTYGLRMMNVFACFANFYIMYNIQKRLYPEMKGLESSLQVLLSAMNLAIFPLLYFFTFLYYTDAIATGLILLTYLLQLDGCTLLATLTASIAVLVRQTNVVWVAFIAFLSISHVLKLHILKYNSRLSPTVSRSTKYLQRLVALWCCTRGPASSNPTSQCSDTREYGTSLVDELSSLLHCPATVKHNTCIKARSWAEAMKPPKMLWLIMLLIVCVVVQYNIISTWLVGGSNSGTGYGFSYAEPGVATAVREELLNAAVNRLRLDDSVSVNIGQKVLHELIMQLGRELLAVGAFGEVSVQTAAYTSLSQVPLTSHATPRLYIITPTYRRPEQIPELTRMAQTLMHVQNLHWLVIEDAENKTQLVSDLLQRTSISHDHLVAPMPQLFKKRKGPKPRGVSNRNRGLEWLRDNATDGVFYFADDDNTYDIRLFEEIRTTKQVSMWPVGLCTKFGLSSPVVVNGTFVGFYDGWVAGRKFPVDMAGFAVNVQFLLKRPKAKMPYKPGFEEDGFLKSLSPFDPEEIELKAKNCTQVLVWHTQTKKNEASAALDLGKYNNTNLVILKQLIV
ncbi:uncharacterized protein LOC110828218 isoform X2 [Zootermopsis nevadensis]|nr:uncharacterized protein LOC110828218 isoform X2 [Zootermopsis nevadensis]XP_021916425.1 uncharacterized protein LOC110828218 isoform X2 [Zootermopsis nevadensis]